MKTLKLTATAVALLISAAPVLAQEAAPVLQQGTAPVAAQEAPAEETSFFTVTGGAAFVSDYRFRGTSLSNKEIAVQPYITLNTAPGFFVGLWGSSIATYGGANTEVDVSGGWTGEVGPVTGTIGIVGYFYPGGTGVDYYELYGTIAKTIGPVGLTLGINYSPGQANLIRDNFYVYGLGTFGIPNTPLTLKASVGYEDGAGAIGVGAAGKSKVDYMVGADFKWKSLTFGVQYIGNDVDKNNFNQFNTKDGFVFSITAGF